MTEEEGDYRQQMEKDDRATGDVPNSYINSEEWKETPEEDEET